MQLLFCIIIAIILNTSSSLGQDKISSLQEEILSSTLHLAEEKLFIKSKEVIAQEISDLLKAAKLGNKDTEYKMYRYRVAINKKGEITNIFFFKTKNTNETMNTLLKDYIQTLAPFKQSAYINDKGENMPFMKTFSVYIQIEENGITLKLPSQEIITVD